MKERPIIFNSEMVRAIIDGRKTMTRRIMKNQPVPSKTREGDYWFSCNKMHSMVHVSDFIAGNRLMPDAHEFFSMSCPFGAVGDRVWVRETFAAFDADWRFPGRPHDLKDGPWPNIIYPADGVKTPPKGTCRPSIHMPRWASRITLEITGVRVERLNSLSESDALAEGCNGGHNSIPGYMYSATPHEHFHHIWETIFGAESWQANPWVWVIEFKRVEGR